MSRTKAMDGNPIVARNAEHKCNSWMGLTSLFNVMLVPCLNVGELNVSDVDKFSRCRFRLRVERSC